MTKFIIAIKQGKLKHFKSEWENHDDIARHNNIDTWDEVIETGIIQEGQILLLDCKQQKHWHKRQSRDDLLWESSWRMSKAREAESLYSYRYAGLREGD
jgi:hypothetical protein